VRGDRKRFESTESGKRELLERFTAAMETSDEQALLALFTPDATWTADGGGKTAASPRPLVGVESIIRLVTGLRRRYWADLDAMVVTVNGEPGLCLRIGGRLIAVMAIESSGDRIHSVYAVLNPDKLAAIEIP
jgi:RNA polymerase sigma-70 factor (ECF subfamily)